MFCYEPVEARPVLRQLQRTRRLRGKRFQQGKKPRNINHAVKERRVQVTVALIVVQVHVGKVRRTAAQRIDPMECRGQLSRSAFEDIYALYLNWCLSDDESCCLQMLSLLPSE